MAGIIQGIQNDIDALRSLQTEIANVRKQLEGIHVKVDINIKEGLEAQLKSLTEQYDVLAAKISESEGKIIATTQRINESAAKIIEMQGQVVQAAQGGGGTTASVEASGVQAQAKAYADLKAEIDTVLGSRNENINRMIDEQNAIRAINDELKAIEKAAGSGGYTAKQSAQIARLNDELLTHKTALAEVRQALNNNAKMDNAAADSMKQLSQELGRMRTAYRELSEEERNSPFGQELLSSIQQMDTKLKELDASLGNHQRNVGNYPNAMAGMVTAQEQFNTAVSALPQNLQNSVKGIQSMTKAAWKFIATPIGAVIGAIVLALQALYTWFSSSVAGQMKFAEISGYVSGVLTQFKEVLIKVGEAIYNTFSDPKQAISDLWEAIKTNVVNRFKAVGQLAKDTGKIIKAVFTLDWDGVREGMQGLLDDWLQLGLGVENVSTKIANAATAVSDWAGNVNEAAKATAEISRQQKELDVEVSKWQEKSAELDKVKAEARRKMYDTSLSKSERAKAVEAYKDAVNQQLKQELEYQDQRIAMQERKMSYSTSSIEDENELRQLKADRVKLEAKYQNELASLQRRTNSINPEEEQKKINEQLLKLRQSNQQDELNLMKDGSEKKIKQIELNYQKELDAIEKQKKEWEKAQGGSLTDEQSTELTAAEDNAEKKKDKELKAVYKQELQYMRDYLKEYGTFQEQKLAIAKEYDEKIAEAENEWQKKALEKEKSAALLKVDVQAAKANIDWKTVFSDLGGIVKEQIQPTIDNLKAITKSDEFKNASYEDQQALYSTIAELEGQVATISIDGFKKVGEDLERFRTSLNNYNDALLVQKQAKTELDLAESSLESAKSKGMDESIIKGLENAVKKAKDKYTEASDNVENFGKEVNENAAELQDSSSKAKSALNGFADALSKLKSGSLVQSLDGVKQLGTTLQGLGGVIGDKIGNALANIDPTGIISGVFAIMDILKDGVSSIFTSLQDTIFGAVEGILEDLFSGDIIMKPLENMIGHVTSILDTVTFGGFSSLFGNGDSDKTLQKDIEYLTASNEDLERAINNLAEKLEETSTAEATDVYNQQKEYLEQSMKNTQEMMQRSGAAYSNGTFGFGGSHSSNYNIDKAMSTADWKRISNITKTTVNSASDFWNLTSEQMAKVADEAADLYTKIKTYADDGHEDAAQYMDEYIEYYKELEELEDAWREKLTNTSFDSVRDEFKDLLLDMESGTEDFAESFEELLRNAVIESLLSNTYDQYIKEWYKNFAKAFEDDGELSFDEAADLKAEWDAMAEEALERRDALFEALGLDSSSSTYSQEASSKGFEVMNQDTGKELNGRFTALQVAGEEIRGYVSILNVTVSEIKDINSGIKDAVGGIQEQLASSYLELVGINENTGESAKYLKTMQSDMKEIKDKVKNL